MISKSGANSVMGTSGKRISSAFRKSRERNVRQSCEKLPPPRYGKTMGHGFFN
jgi:hypothetical protein